MKTMDPLVSIIVLTYNSEKYVVETLDSIKGQTYQNIELIISDDCSTDGTRSVCADWIELNGKRFCRAKIVTTPENTGIPANCNRGIKDSSGEWIKLIAGDDLLYPDAIKIFINEMKSHDSEEKLAFHGKVKEFENNILLEPILSEWIEPRSQNFNKKETTPREQFNILLRFCPISATTVLLHKSVFEKTGYFDERFKFWEDRPMWLKMTSGGIKLNFVNADITKYRRHDGSVQMNSNNVMFSRTLLSKDEGSRIVILPYLPFHERLLNLYIFSVRRCFYRIFSNKKTRFINILYKILVIFAEKWLTRIKSHYSS
jgi:glycosyltransferase involved in cell wall biosynthesis